MQGDTKACREGSIQIEVSKWLLKWTDQASLSSAVSSKTSIHSLLQQSSHLPQPCKVPIWPKAVSGSQCPSVVLCAAEIFTVALLSGLGSSAWPSEVSVS